MCHNVRARKAQSSRASSIVVAPSILGLFADKVLRLRRAESFSGASPSSAAKLSDYRRQLFMGPPVTRKWTDNLQRPLPRKTRVHLSNRTSFHLTILYWRMTYNKNRRTPYRGEIRPEETNNSDSSDNERADLEDVLTQLTQEIVTMRREVATH